MGSISVVDGGYRVLVIDDDPDVALYTRTVLERRGGCTVVAIVDPSLARATVAEFDPEIVVTDIEMPGISGLDLITILREESPGLPIVMMTAHLSVDYALRAMRDQADEFLTKPIVSKELVAIVQRLGSERRRRRASAEERNRAAEVQKSLLPRQSPDLPGWDLAGGCAPARVVGGDFFDWYPVDGGIAITLADVMGKGTGAALIAATVRAVLRANPEENDTAAAMTRAAASLANDLEHSGTFVTAFHSRLQTDSGRLSYADAGHGLSLVVRNDGGVERLRSRSMPLGMGTDEVWLEHTVDLEPGDTLVTVSDGVLDIYDGTLASLDEVERVSRAAPNAQAIVDHLLALAEGFDSDGAGAPDDVTVVALRRAN
jgi:sigma-B regulation protein RsbU (phosphoserine phosphatase)